MFKFNELTQLQIEITNRCQASCALCARNVHGGLDNPSLQLNDWTLDNFKKIFSQEVLDQISVIDIAGTAGEPTLNKELIEMCEYVKVTNPAVYISIYTNAGARSTSWWADLAHALPDNHSVVFALDGLADTNHLYRTGIDFDMVIKHAQAFISAGGKATWQYIQFKHNQHQVDQAVELAEQLGFQTFVLKSSRRHGDEPFKVLDRAGQVTHYLESAEETAIKFIRKDDFVNFKDWPNAGNINCYVKKNKEIYIDANYITLPCCILGSFTYLNIDHNKELYKDFDVYNSVSNFDAGYGVNKNFVEVIDRLGGMDRLDTSKRSIQDLLDSDTWQTIWQQLWDEKSSDVCIKMCSQSSPFSSMDEQDIRRINFSK